MASDDFTNTNGTLLATHDSSWASIGETGTSNTYDVGDFEIQSNECSQENGFQRAGARYSTSTENSSEVIAKPHSGGNGRVSVCIQATSTRRGYYIRLAGYSSPNYTQVDIREDDGTADNFRASSGGSAFTAPDTGDITLKIYADGDDIVVDINGTEEVRWEDTTQLTGGNPGFFCTPSLNDADFDDWTDGATVGSNQNFMTLLGVG